MLDNRFEKLEKTFWWIKKSLFAGLMLITGSCLEPYAPPEITAPDSYLVVDGFLNGGQVPTVIKLSRTQNLAEKEKPPVEAQAQVSVESEGGSLFSFTESDAGTYTLTNAPLQFGEKYRLRIRTALGKEYLSEYVPLKQTPAIDTVSWDISEDGMQIYLNTHDPNNNTLYYRWEFAETWEFMTPYQASYIYRAGEKDFIYENRQTCWRTETSKSILLGSTVRLSQDIIYKYPLVFLPANSVKHRIKYSIYVRQYAITKEEFDYLQNLKKNTENIGTLFDPQPSQLTSNIKCVNTPEEPVFGYFGGSSVSERRIFVTPADLPKWKRTTGYEACMMDTIKTAENAGYLQRAVFPVISEYYGMTGGVEGYLTSTQFCLDCRTAGTNVKPDFWR